MTSHSEDMLEYARKYADDRDQRLIAMMNETKNITNQMNDELQAQVSAQETRIERLEAWILEVITKPSMSRQHRLEGLDLLSPVDHRVRQSVERICTPSQGISLEQGLVQEI